MKKSASWAAAVMLTCLTLTACGQTDSDDAPVPEEQTSSSAPESTSAVPASEPIEITNGEVPNLRSHSLWEAITALREADLHYEISGEGFETDAEATRTREWRVIDQSPAAGADAEPRSVVKLTVERIQ